MKTNIEVVRYLDMVEDADDYQISFTNDNGNRETIHVGSSEACIIELANIFKF